MDPVCQILCPIIRDGTLYVLLCIILVNKMNVEYILVEFSFTRNKLLVLTTPPGSKLAYNESTRQGHSSFTPGGNHNNKLA